MESGNILLKRGLACSLTAMGMLCAIRNDVKSVSALLVANSVSFKKKVLILEHALPVACTVHADSMTMCVRQSYNSNVNIGLTRLTINMIATYLRLLKN